MINIKLARQSDFERWDEYVISRSNASPYHLIAWKKAVEKAYGHKGYYLMAEKDGHIVGLLPLIHFKLYAIINELVALPYCDVGNCISDNASIQDTLLQKTVSLAQSLQAKKIQLRGEFRFDRLPVPHFPVLNSNKVRMLLELPGSSAMLLKNFKSKVRSQIRKAEKNGVIFRWTGQDGVEPFYSVFCLNMKKLGSPVHSRKWFESVMIAYGSNARIGLTEYNGQCIGAGLILFTDTQTAVPWASTLSLFNHLNPNMLLYWNFLKFSADKGMRLFDFGRSTVNGGTYKFKKQWGAQPFPLHWYSSAKAAESERDFKIGATGRDLMAKIWQKSPLYFANTMGPVLRKYISL